MKLKYIVNMKPEFITQRITQHLLQPLIEIDDTSDQIIDDEQCERKLTRSIITLVYRNHTFRLRDLSPNLTLVYTPEELNHEDELRIKKVLKFKQILNHIARRRGIDDLATAVSETIDCFDVYYTLNNILNYGDIDHTARVVFNIVNKTLYLKKPELLGLLTKPSRDYEMPPRFMLLRTIMDFGAITLTDMIKAGNIHHFLLDSNYQAVRDVFPFHELLRISDENTSGLRRDLYDFRLVLRRIVERDPEATLCIRTPDITYGYVISTGEEKTSYTPPYPSYAIYPNDGVEKKLFYLDDLNRAFDDESIFMVMPYPYVDIDFIRAKTYLFNYDVDIEYPQPKAATNIATSDLDDGVMKIYEHSSDEESAA